jgi:ligand-binding sensor domain-containing protein
MMTRMLAARRVLLAGVVAACLVAAPASAQQAGRRPFATLGPDQGLPSGAVITMAQDADGFIWLGTENGLVRYEGAGHWRRWSIAEGLPSAWIPRLLPARDGGLWVATLRGLVRFQHGKSEPALFGDSPSSTSVAHLAKDNRGRVWVATPAGLFVHEHGLQFRPHSARIEGRLHALFIGPQSGAVYVATERGILAIHADDSTHTWGPADGLPEGGPTLVAEDGAGRLWAGSGRTLVMKPPDAGRFIDESARLWASLSPNSSPWVDRDGSVWLPTQGGALRIGAADQERLDTSNGLPFRWVRSVTRDREGTLWVIGPALARLQGGGRVWNYSLSDEDSGEVAWFINRDRDGRLLVATDDGAVRMGPDGATRIPGTEGRRIKYLAVDHGGTLWLVNTLGPTLWLHAGASAAVQAPLGALGSSVNSVMVDTAGRVWLGHTRHGVMRWDPDTRRLVQDVSPAFAGAPTLGAYGMREDSAGRLWVGSSSGLLMRDAQGRWHRFTTADGLHAGTVRGLDFLQDGSAWVHYQEPVGLTRVRLDGTRLTAIEHRVSGQGLRSNLVYAVAVDDRQHVWITTDQGLDRLDPPLHIGRHHGMASEDCAVHALLTESGRVWVGTASGLVRYDVDEALSAPTVPHARILDVHTGTQRVEPPLGRIGPVPYKAATLEFRVAAPSYADERALRFQVRLEGVEDEWVETTSRTVRYPALRGGSYRFGVRAAIGHGPFGPAAYAEVDVLPPWWNTWWAYLAVLLAAFAAVLAIVRWRVAALAQSKAALEEVVAQRTAELRARNAELSDALGKVKQLSGLLPICANCRKVRDDKGYWNQLDLYLRAHSDLDFSHGICPACAKELYPDFDLSADDETRKP